MAESLIEPMIKWIEMRRSIFQEPPVRALTMRERELIALAMERIAHEPKQAEATRSEGYATLAIKEGATVKESAEVCMMAICWDE
jgi:alkylhydroperoxidase/carboxymuconolactone decarboxylase family protein YurZ